MAVKITGNSATSNAEVDSNNNIQVVTPGTTPTGGNRGGGNQNAPSILTENDGGSKTSLRYVGTPEADNDSRLRVANELWLDDEQFNYAAQNTGKHQYQNTTMTLVWATSGLQTNGTNITSTTTGTSLRSYAYFPITGMGNSTYAQFQASLNANLNANQVIDFGLFLQPTSNPFIPTDGLYFRADSSGWKAVINNNGTEVEQLLNGSNSSGTFTHVNNTVYKFLIEINQSQAVFWINDTIVYRVSTPNAQGQFCLSNALPIGIRHAIVGGAAGSALQATFKEYSVSIGGGNFSEKLGDRGNAIFGSYQGLSGGTMGSLSSYTNSTNPTAAIPSNTVLTANLPSGLGGQSWETFTLAVNTDGILMSYQVPLGTISIPGKRLKITGVKLSSFVQTVLVGGPLNRTFTLNYGHTSVSLATGEAATTKARRIVLLPELTQTVTAAQAVNTMVSQSGGCISMFPEPIYINPGEFISLSVKHIGTVGLSGTVATNIQYIYSWE